MSDSIYKVVRNGKPVHGRAYFSSGHAKLSSQHNYSSEVVEGQAVWPDDTESVVISIQEYESLKHSADWLQCLEDAGVDNWSGIDYAYEMMNRGVDFDEV